jgi:hypothetical protein
VLGKENSFLIVGADFSVPLVLWKSSVFPTQLPSGLLGSKCTLDNPGPASGRL